MTYRIYSFFTFITDRGFVLCPFSFLKVWKKDKAPTPIHLPLSLVCAIAFLLFPFIRKILLFARYRRTDRQIYLFYYLLYYLLYYFLYYPGVILSPPCCHFGSTPLPFCPPQSDRLSRRLCHFVPHGHFVPGQKSLFCPAPLCLYYTIFSRVCKYIIGENLRIKNPRSWCRLHKTPPARMPIFPLCKMKKPRAKVAHSSLSLPFSPFIKKRLAQPECAICTVFAISHRFLLTSVHKRCIIELDNKINVTYSGSREILREILSRFMTTLAQS